MRGDRKLACVDYDPTKIYALVASHGSIHMLFSVAASELSYLEGEDTSNASLYGDLDGPIVMEQSIDSIQLPVMPRYSCKLIKSIYRSIQAGEMRGSLSDESLRSWGFILSKFDERISSFQEGIDLLNIEVVFDDLAFALNSIELMIGLIQKLSAHFDVMLFGALTPFVGWNILQSQHEIKINQNR